MLLSMFFPGEDARMLVAGVGEIIECDYLCPTLGELNNTFVELTRKSQT